MRKYQSTDDVIAAAGLPPDWEPAAAEPRVPLTTNQHILFLLLTVFTGGLGAIVWIIRAAQGNRAAVSR